MIRLATVFFELGEYQLEAGAFADSVVEFGKSGFRCVRSPVEASVVIVLYTHTKHIVRVRRTAVKCLELRKKYLPSTSRTLAET
jgi:hypothetical protein